MKVLQRTLFVATALILSTQTNKIIFSSILLVLLLVIGYVLRRFEIKKGATKETIA